MVLSSPPESAVLAHYRGQSPRIGPGGTPFTSAISPALMRSASRPNTARTAGSGSKPWACAAASTCARNVRRVPALIVEAADQHGKLRPEVRRLLTESRSRSACSVRSARQARSRSSVPSRSSGPRARDWSAAGNGRTPRSRCSCLASMADALLTVDPTAAPALDVGQGAGARRATVVCRCPGAAVLWSRVPALGAP